MIRVELIHPPPVDLKRAFDVNLFDRPLAAMFSK